MAVTCRASSEHPEMPQVVLLLKMPCDSTFWTGTQVANHSWPPVLAKSWTRFPETRILSHSKCCAGCCGPLRSYSLNGAIYSPAQRNRWTARAIPQTETPHSTQKSELPREKGVPLTCSLYKQFGGSSSFSPPGPAFSLQREYLTVVAQGGPKLVDILLTNLQNFTQKDLTKVKIVQKLFWGATFLKHRVYEWIMIRNYKKLS